MATNLAHVTLPPEDSEMPEEPSVPFSYQSQELSEDPERDSLISRLTTDLQDQRELSKSSSNTSWLLHPGTAHYAPSRSVFSSYTPVQAVATLSGTRESLLIVGIGVVELQVQPHADFNSDEGGVLELNLALHIPAAQSSGLSETRLRKAGNAYREDRLAGAWAFEDGDGRTICFGTGQSSRRQVAVAGGEGEVSGVTNEGKEGGAWAVDVSRKELQVCLRAMAESLAKAKACAEWFYAGDDGPKLPSQE